MSSGLISTLLLKARRLSEARNRWRRAARVAAMRWDLFVGAQSGGRALAFAAYLAALDGEEAAAAELASLFPRTCA
jgi:hypothetical protein